MQNSHFLYFFLLPLECLELFKSILFSLVLEFSGEEPMSVLLTLIIYISICSGPDMWLSILYMNKPLFRHNIYNIMKAMPSKFIFKPVNFFIKEKKQRK